jgi:hypothetical protein
MRATCGARSSLRGAEQMRRVTRDRANDIVTVGLLVYEEEMGDACAGPGTAR